MKFSLAVVFSPLHEFAELAKAAQANGFASIALPDSMFYSEHVSADYPYTPDGSRFWTAETEWADPLVAAAHMAAHTSTLRFYTQVLKLGSRQPLVLARQLGTLAVLSGNRFGFGIGLGWSPEEFEWCGVPYARRGARADEFMEVLARILGGGMVEYHGEFFDFDPLQMSPAPSEPMPIYVGGHTEPALRRAARIGDGWTSAMIRFDELRTVIERLTVLRTEYGRAERDYEIQAVCVDRFGADGYREQADIGVTDAIVLPWVFEGHGFDAPLSVKIDSIKRFADTTIGEFG